MSCVSNGIPTLRNITNTDLKILSIYLYYVFSSNTTQY